MLRMNHRIIFDLDDTLINSTWNDIDGLPASSNAVMTKHLIVYKRPYADELVNWCLENMQAVAVWTAANKKWAKTVTSAVFPQMKDKLDFIWYDKHCHYEYDDFTFYGRRDDPPRGKSLEYLFKKKPAWTPQNTIFVDDSNISDWHACHMKVSSWDYNNVDDDELLQVMRSLV